MRGEGRGEGEEGEKMEGEGEGRGEDRSGGEFGQARGRRRGGIGGIGRGKWCGKLRKGCMARFRDGG